MNARSIAPATLLTVLFTAGAVAPAHTALTVNVLVVAGGGGGGASLGRGGGAGGVLAECGARRVGRFLSDHHRRWRRSNTNGGNSVFDTMTAIGGGKGAATSPRGIRTSRNGWTAPGRSTLERS